MKQYEKIDRSDLTGTIIIDSSESKIIFNKYDGYYREIFYSRKVIKICLSIYNKKDFELTKNI